jgi:hypothetical protein
MEDFCRRNFTGIPTQTDGSQGCTRRTEVVAPNCCTLLAQRKLPSHGSSVIKEVAPTTKSKVAMYSIDESQLSVAAILSFPLAI